jgi:hypothetical protein
LAITNPIRPPGTGLTEEAKEALNLSDPEIPFPEDLAEEPADYGDAPEDVEAETGPPLFTERTGEYIEGRRLRTKALPTPEPRDASKGIPSIDEWMDFFSRIVLRVLCDWYIFWAFRGIEEEWLTDREVDRLQLTDEERQRISVPLAELSNKSKVMRKHGRTIVASGGAFDALLTLGTWASRVNRIAGKYRKRILKGETVVGTGSDAQEGSAPNGRIGEWTIYNPGG